ncbi:MAG: glucokinase, partial [Rhodoplanes sp.]
MSTTLVADIGGSNTRLAVAGRTGRAEHVHAFANDSVPGLVAAIGDYLTRMESMGQRPDAAVLAVAGPVQGRRIVLTNRAWEIDLDAIQHRFSFRYVRALNDFEALAWALPWFEPEDVRQLGPALPVRNGTKAVLGPGTGLGVAALLP